MIRHGTRRVFFRFVKSKGCGIRKRRNEGRNGTVVIRMVGAGKSAVMSGLEIVRAK